MICPDCNSELSLIYDEVDIGVGIQKHLHSIECPKCGPLAFCDQCGKLDDACDSSCPKNIGFGADYSEPFGNDGIPTDSDTSEKSSGE